MSAPHNIGIEREAWDTYAESTRKSVFEHEPSFRWTQYTNHGPGTEVLGDPQSVLEIGCGTGRALAFLAERGIKATGIDLSPVMVEQITERWSHLGARFICAEVLEHLAADSGSYDAVYSIFGAAWFTDPVKLLPLVAKRLRDGGVFAFSQPPAIPGAYGVQGMYKGSFAARAMCTYRYDYTPETWHELLENAGFTETEAHIIEAPEPDHVRTLMVRAVKG